mmetsp:Transcript_12868/g.24481  ORF Transcript_12868/g.24481 Transcript_12868/m.24481 type:complete len:387 (-) Transcript_12868:101-1261(-)|eukprot:CAMPEP_0114238820 /NCGR_PEP_ID=MMETSP0058-20121206/8124_1 /TAXON_ID=36894 /ORGANISM="Pyramimonas parkeae, CCMP726" /LENGTH=386 /DNA_ID=CAMNT_0001350947 /DNA_START=134 /DNA_END=1294 /DNA_ORIENTATION=+
MLSAAAAAGGLGPGPVAVKGSLNPQPGGLSGQEPDWFPISSSPGANMRDPITIHGPGPGAFLWKLRRHGSFDGLSQQADSTTGASDDVVREYQAALRSDGDMAVAVAAIKALTFVIENSKASTMMEVEKELKSAADSLRGCQPSSISLAAACELFMRYVTRTGAVDHHDLKQSRKRLIERGNVFAETSLQARAKIAALGQRFVREGGVVLTHGFSRVVISVLKAATKAGKNFTVVVTEGRPEHSGTRMAKVLLAAGIPTTLVLDSAAAFVMERVDMVLVGSEGVVENGGVINKLGTFQIATVAKAMGKPVYVAAESYKFARLYPLNQRDMPNEQNKRDLAIEIPEGMGIVNPIRDYTPPDKLTLLFTDLGVLTPSAVSDELIQLYL